MANSNSDSYPWWDDRLRCTASFSRSEADVKINTDTFKTPRSLYEYFDSKVYGCHEYKKALSTAIWTSLNLKTKTNFLVIGPSGCGKTELARVFSKIYKNTVIFDASSVSPLSYKGNATISQCLLEVDTSDEALPPWIFIDEIDKAITKQDGLGEMIMNELLKMIEGGKIYTGKDERSKELIDTSRVNFVFLGTFSFLKKNRKNVIGFNSETAEESPDAPITRDMLYDSGALSNEFLGRLNGGILEVEPMDEEKALNLLKDHRYSPVDHLAKEYKMQIKLTPEKQLELVRMVSKFGIRGIYSELQNRINDALFEDCTIQTLTI